MAWNRRGEQTEGRDVQSGAEQIFTFDVLTNFIPQEKGDNGNNEWSSKRVWEKEAVEGADVTSRIQFDL